MLAPINSIVISHNYARRTYDLEKLDYHIKSFNLEKALQNFRFYVLPGAELEFFGPAKEKNDLKNPALAEII